LEKVKDPIGEKLKLARKARKVSVPKISTQLDIPMERIYKWEQGKSTPGYEDKLRIENWLKDRTWKYVPHGTLPPGTNSSEKEPSKDPGPGVDMKNPQRDARDEELIQVLKKQNDFLERMLESSLSSLATTQQVVLAEVKAGLKYGALKDAGGNKKKEAEILAQISRTAGEYLQTFGVKDNASIVDR